MYILLVQWRSFKVLKDRKNLPTMMSNKNNDELTKKAHCFIEVGKPIYDEVFLQNQLYSNN